METKRKALGRGLEDLFSSDNISIEQFEENITRQAGREVTDLNLKLLKPNPYQPRKNFDKEALQELSDSIKEHGVFQPIIVSKTDNNEYLIVAGERRVRASKMAGLEKIPAIIKSFSDEDMMEIALLENLQREDLNPIEEATAYSKLLESLNITQEELAKKLGKSRSYITNMLGLLKLPNTVKNDLSNGSISIGHARALSKISDKDMLKELANRIKDEKLTVRETEALTSRETVPKNNKISKRTKANTKTNDYNYYEDKLIDKFGTKVKIDNKKISIYYVNDNDLERILEIVGVDYGS